MKPEVIATRRTYDGKLVQLWSDGALTWAFGQYIRGAPRKPGLDAGWAVIGEVEIVDSEDVPLFIKAAQHGGLPGEIRSRFHAMKRRIERSSEVPKIKLHWETIEADRDGRPVARVARLPRILYPGLAIWHERGKYEIVRRVMRDPAGYLPHRSERGRNSDTYETTGFSSSTLREILAQLPQLRDTYTAPRSVGEAQVGETVTDRSTHPTVVEYAVRELFKRKGPAAAAKTTAAKLSGFENMFLGPGVTVIDPVKLEAALWDRMADVTIKAMSHYKAGKEHMAIEGTLQQFNQSMKLAPKLKAVVDRKQALPG